jgi:hypothetical protein
VLKLVLLESIVFILCIVALSVANYLASILIRNISSPAIIALILFVTCELCVLRTSAMIQSYQLTGMTSMQ